LLDNFTTFLSCDECPEVKIIFSIREDYLAYFEEMSREIPDILQNRFRLLPLTREQAQTAIVEPALIQNKKIQSKSFTYEPEALESMLNFLSKRQEREETIISNEVEPFQLQLLCSHLEEKLNKDSEETIVTEKVLGGEAAMQQVLEGFYDRQLKNIDSLWKRKRISRLCEKGLVSLKDRRLSLELGEIEQKYKVSEEELNQFVNSRLLRAEPRVGSVYYELSHDTLVKPIRQAQQKRFRQKVKASISLLILILMIVIGVFIISKYTQKNLDQLYSELQEQIEQKEFTNAHNTFEQILKISDKPETAYLKYAKSLEDMQQIEMAKGLYEEAITKNIQNAIIHKRLADILSSLDKLGEAITHYMEALNIEPKLLSAYIGIGHAYLKQKKYYLARSFFYMGIQQQIKQEQFDDAQDTFEQLLKKAVDREKEYIKYGEILEEMQQIEKAKCVYDEAIKKDVKSAIIHEKIANILRYRNKSNEAIFYYEEALKIDPKRVSVYVDMGDIYFDNRKYNDAIKIYNKLIEIAKEHIDKANQQKKQEMQEMQELNRQKEILLKELKAIQLEIDMARSQGESFQKMKNINRLTIQP
jgi:tetratricopeptide (TPR) repeat protein